MNDWYSYETGQEQDIQALFINMTNKQFKLFFLNRFGYFL